MKKPAGWRASFQAIAKHDKMSHYYRHNDRFRMEHTMSSTPQAPEMFPSRSTPEMTVEDFREALRELSMTPGDLADFMDKNGDPRDMGATIRSIQRMISGDTRVSGEMTVIINILLRRHRRLQLRYKNVVWNQNERGVYWAQFDDWYVYISPQTRGRWILSCSHGPSPKDYSPPFGRWLNSLEEAKNKAFACVEEGMNEEATILFEYEKLNIR